MTRGHPAGESIGQRTDLRDGLERARQLLSDRRASDALTVLRPLVDRHPGSAQAFALVGFAYREEQWIGEALAAFGRAVDLDPQNLQAALALAQTRYEAGLPAVAEASRALDLAPNDLTAIRACALALAAEGQSARAEELLRRAVERQPAWVDGHVALAKLRWTEGNGDRATASFAVALNQRPDLLPVGLAWFQTAVLQRDLASAIGILDRLERTHGGRPDLVLARLVVATESGDTDGAEQLFERTRAMRGPVRDLALIRHSMKLGRLDEAEQTALQMTRTANARLAWPYLSIIWRLNRDPRAGWLDGAPPYIREYDLRLTPAEMAEAVDLLRTLHVAQRPYLGQSVRGGTQTDGQLFFRQERIIRRVRSEAERCFTDFAANLPVTLGDGHPLWASRPIGRLRYGGSWSVRLLEGGYNVPHTHPLGWFSSAMYLVMPSVAERGPAPAGWIEFGRPPVELGLALEPYLRIEPKPGRLVVFPSTTWHGTVPFSDGERIVIAADIAPPSLRGALPPA